MRPQPVQRELNSPSQMLINGSFLFIRKRYYFIEEVRISAFRNIFIYRRKQPQSIICTVSRMPGFSDITVIFRGIFMTRIMRKLHQRQTASVMHLCRQHKLQPVFGKRRIKVNDALNILHGVTVSVAVAQSAVDKGCRTGPDHGHIAVIGIPDVDHGIEFFGRRFDFQCRKPGCPELF